MTMNQDGFDATSIDRGSALYFLLLLYRSALKIVAASTNGLVRYDSQLLNHYYTTSLFFAGKITDRPDLAALSNTTNFLPTTLLGSDELDTDWQYDKKPAYEQLVKIEDAWREAGQPSFAVPSELQSVFDDIDATVSEYVKEREKKEEIITNKPFSGKSFTSNTKLYTEDATAQQEVNGLAVYSDGSIRYKGEPVEMRSQLKELCRLFIANPNRLVTLDDIREKLIAASKREHTPFSTVAKYVSELRRILEVHFHKDVLLNQKEEGWYFKP